MEHEIVSQNQDIESISTSANNPADTQETPLTEFLDRDLTWLDFNRRVLHEAADERNPLLERVRFLSIFSSNLDEFFMKRVGRLRTLAPRRLEELNPAEVLKEVKKRVAKLLVEAGDCFSKDLKRQLSQNGIELLKWKEIRKKEQDWARKYFMENVFPVLTPLSVDSGHPFPFISNLSTNLGVALSHPERDEMAFARVKVPEVLPQWIQLNGGEHRYISLVELIQQNLEDLFPGMWIVDSMPFRLTRDMEGEHDDEAEDMREMVAQELKQRRFARVVRLEHSKKPNEWMLKLLKQELKLTNADIYEIPEEPGFTELKAIAQLPSPNLRFKPWVPVAPAGLADEETDMFSLIRAGDLLVHHPYESFSASVERFIEAAAADPNVLAIKMTVYRTGDDSPFIRTLIRAAEAKKQVVCLVELKARFDEERNILLAQALEKAGVHVVYGFVGLKTHTKTALVVRRDPDGIRCYAHIGTGNYNVETARLYTDLGIFTCKPEFTGDLVKLFHYMTGRSLKPNYEKLLVAPANMRDQFLALIHREIENHKASKPAYILAKMNSLEDHMIIRALYLASNQGVKIDLIVRGFCTLKPGVKGMSENIRVMSIVGRFLEHSRIFYFQNGAENPVDGEFFIGSADWMYRNLLGRVEVVTPLESKTIRENVWDILQTQLNDNRLAWDMKPDGAYVQRKPAEGEDERNSHAIFMNQANQPL